MKSLKLLLSLMIMAILTLFFACQSDKKGQKETEITEETPTEDEVVIAVGTDEKDTTAIVENQELTINKADAEALMQSKLPILYELSKDNTTIGAAINRYAYTVLNADKLIDSEPKLQSVFNERDNELIPAINEEILEPLSEVQDTPEDELFNTKKVELLEKELNSIGMGCVFAEGFYMGLAPKPMLADALKKHGSEPFQWLMDFKSGEGMAQGGEYTYMGLEGEGVMVSAAEKMRKNHPDHPYNKLIEGVFRSALTVLTDFHKVEQGERTSFLVHDLTTEYFPSATEKEYLSSYSKKYPASKYSSVIDKLLANPSELIYDKKKGWNDLFLVIVGWKAAEKSLENGLCAATRQQVFAYLDKGIDIPHSLLFWRGEQRECAIVHRFFADETKAKAAAKAIQSQLTDGEAVTIEKARLDTKTFTWKILEK